MSEDDLRLKTPQFVHATDTAPHLPPQNPPKWESSSSKNLSQPVVSILPGYIASYSYKCTLNRKVGN